MKIKKIEIMKEKEYEEKFYTPKSGAKEYLQYIEKLKKSGKLK